MKKILIIAGEPSGDLHGGHFLQELSALRPGLRVRGIGGPCMRKAGLEALVGIEQLSFMGIKEVLAHYGLIRRALNTMKAEVDAKPDLVVLIDFPDFNFKIGQYAKKRGVPVFYYIAPQVWAWRAGRAKAMSGFVDQLAVVFKFEEEVFNCAGVKTSFVGHPLLDQEQSCMPAKAFWAELGLREGERLVGLLPGSREQEIRHILPAMAEAANLVAAEMPELRFAVSCAPSLDPGALERRLPKKGKARLPVLGNRTGEIMRHSSAAMVTSGTATLETALAGTPMVVVYKTSGLTYYGMRPFVKIRNISLVNILAGRTVVPELVQAQATGERIACEVKRILGDAAIQSRMREAYGAMAQQMGNSGASRRAAELAVQTGEL